MGLLKINLGSLILFVLLSYQPLDTAASRMQTSAFGKSKGLRETLSEGTWMEAFNGLGISIILTCNPSIQVLNLAFLYNECCIGLQIDNMSYGVQLCQLFVFKQLNIDTEDCVEGILYSIQHGYGYGYAYRYRKDTDARIRQFLKQPDTRIRFNYFINK